MDSTSTEAVIIQAVLAGSSFGAGAGAWASASGACTRTRSSHPIACSFFTLSLPFCLVLVRAAHREEAYLSLAGGEVLGVKAEGAAAAVGEPALEREADGAKRDVLPWNPVFFPERHLERLLARLEVER